MAVKRIMCKLEFHWEYGHIDFDELHSFVKGDHHTKKKHR